MGCQQASSKKTHLGRVDESEEVAVEARDDETLGRVAFAFLQLFGPQTAEPTFIRRTSLNSSRRLCREKDKRETCMNRPPNQPSFAEPASTRAGDSPSVSARQRKNGKEEKEGKEKRNKKIQKRKGETERQKEEEKDEKKEKETKETKEESEKEEKEVEKSENQRGSAQNGWAGGVNHSRES